MKWVISYDDGHYNESNIEKRVFNSFKKAQKYLKKFLEENPDEDKNSYFIEKITEGDEKI
ncbi:MAG: hypothetical protein QXP60_05780 [Nitrososphaerota archaeon]